MYAGGGGGGGGGADAGAVADEVAGAADVGEAVVVVVPACAADGWDDDERSGRDSARACDVRAARMKERKKERSVQPKNLLSRRQNPHTNHHSAAVCSVAFSQQAVVPLLSLASLEPFLDWSVRTAFTVALLSDQKKTVSVIQKMLYLRRRIVKYATNCRVKLAVV
jgi:hypothetical protein